MSGFSIREFRRVMKQSEGETTFWKLVNERIAGLLVDKCIAGREAEMVREYYGMYLDWDSRAQGKEFFLEHLKPIQDIDSLERLSTYLSSEDSLYYGSGLMDLVLDRHQERPEEWMLRIRTTTLSLDDSGEYEGDTPSETFDAICASSLLQYAGYSAEDAAKLVEQGYAFEKLLNQAITSAEDSYTADERENVPTLFSREELATASPKFPYWQSWSALASIQSCT